MVKKMSGTRGNNSEPKSVTVHLKGGQKTVYRYCGQKWNVHSKLDLIGSLLSSIH